jgi:hypothetical protein
MVSPIDRRKIMWPVPRDEGERLLIDKFDEMISEINRLEQIVNFLSEVAHNYEGNNNLTNDDDVQ